MRIVRSVIFMLRNGPVGSGEYVVEGNGLTKDLHKATTWASRKVAEGAIRGNTCIGRDLHVEQIMVTLTPYGY